uniref:(northern house mosquito) hypothetical protein n=1 Tax=Culex pipiens TaxID=7175 RepID=A0A8D8B2E2_CULPI
MFRSFPLLASARTMRSIAVHTKQDNFKRNMKKTNRISEINRWSICTEPAVDRARRPRRNRSTKWTENGSRCRRGPSQPSRWSCRSYPLKSESSRVWRRSHPSSSSRAQGGSGRNCHYCYCPYS